MTKKLWMTTILTALCASSAAFALDLRPGIYLAKLDVEGPYYVAEINLDANGTYTFRDAQADTVMPKPGCSGTYTMSGNTFSGSLDCSAVGGGQISQKIDLSTATDADLQSSDGARVTVTSSALENQPMPFRLFKRKSPYLP